MTSWRDVNKSIQACRSTPDPTKCLETLFIRTRDAHVAMALGTELEGRGRFEDARQWFETAAQRYPKLEFKAKAQAALRRVNSKVQDGPTVKVDPLDESVLHVVECSKQKIWNDDIDAARFVPARQAYRGEAITKWLSDPRASSSRWLVLSARYGFIEPEQPIENYDVTFANEGTGPITIDTLRAQVTHQTRWADAFPLAQFQQVVVHGGSDYASRVRAAFRDAQVVVESLDGSLSAIPTSRDPGRLIWSRERAQVIGVALSRIPQPVFEAFDRNEPEWQVVERLAAWTDQRLARLAAMCLGFSDYQLGTGGADSYWDVIGQEITKTDESIAGVLDLMIRVSSHPVSSRLANQKLARVRKATERWADGSAPDEPSALWRWLASTLGQNPDAKTVVMAMKIVDLMNLARHAKYLDFGAGIPLPVDLRIARLSLTSGLLQDSQGHRIDHQATDANEIASGNRPLLVSAWRAVSESAGGISLLRIDSLAWQLAEHVKGKNPETVVRQRLVDVGCPPDVASDLARELTQEC